ncbi:MAG: hypothetical protein ACRELG_00525, partial [Gemmataceae bacterium]
PPPRSPSTAGSNAVGAEQFEVEHIVPTSRGGSEDEANPCLAHGGELLKKNTCSPVPHLQ